MSPKVFVAGATGTQGGALVRHLLPSKVTIHALARDPSSAKAKALQDLGVTVHHGSFDDESALRAAITPGTTAIFLNFMPVFTDHGANLRQAKLIMSVAKEVGVPHVVYTSGVAMDRVREICEGMESSIVETLLLKKLEIEEAVKAAGFDTYTILRPGNFMANYIDPFVRRQVVGLAETGRSVGALDIDAPLPMVSTQTIGAFSAAAILEPERFGGKTIDYADEFVTFRQVLQKLRDVTGKDLQYTTMSKEDIQAQIAVNPFLGGALAVSRLGKYVNLDGVKSWGIPLQTFDEYLKSEKQAVLDTYAESPSV